MKQTTVIFDLDGTLLNTIADLGAAVNYVLEAHGFKTHDMASYKMMVGRGMRNLVKAALPPEKSKDDATVDKCLKEFFDYYMENIDRYTVPYPGIPELVKQLQEEGYKLAVASNKLQKGTEKLIREFFPDIDFVAVCGNCPEYPLKPDPALVQYIINKAGTQSTIMIGDSDIDIRTAHNAGIPVIAATWGFRPKENLKEADFIVDTPDEIKQILNNTF